MTIPPIISDAEWEVMNVLWASARPLVANDVVEQLAGHRSWSPRTVKTLLNRLVKKHALKFDVQGNRYLYRPAVPREQCVRAAGQSFLSRVFSGSAGPMLVHFVTHAKLSATELAELQKLLDAKQAEASRPSQKKAR